MNRAEIRKSGYLVPQGRTHVASFGNHAKLHADLHQFHDKATACFNDSVRCLTSASPKLPNATIPVLEIEGLGFNKSQLYKTALEANGQLPDQVRFLLKPIKQYRSYEDLATLVQDILARLDEFKREQLLEQEGQKE